MRPQFPGMDPWLEHPDLWPDVHNSLITAIRDELMPKVLPRYVVRVESRTTVLTGLDVDLLYRPDLAVRSANLSAPAHDGGVAVAEPPKAKQFHVVVSIEDDEIEETFLTIQELPSRKLVTAIEVLSPTNKKTKDARAEYLAKRRNLIRTNINFVEIDLLRSGDPMPVRNCLLRGDYRVLVCRSRLGRTADLYGFSYTTPIPDFPIPLLPGDAEPTLKLNGVLHALIDRARYDLTIDYRMPPEPPLRPEDESWAAAIIAHSSDQSPESTPGNGAAP
jgi:Protein of unknown function (DUF4058)